MPSLEDAYLKANRAREYFEELKKIHDIVCAEQAKATIIKFQPNLIINPGEAKKVLEVQTGQAPIPDKCRLLVGDIVNNLRSALNYLIVQLAVLDSGSKTRELQFPIESSADQFKKNRKKILRGLNEKHVAVIEQLQPYSGCQWSQCLQRLSNFDKHEQLVIVAHDYSLNMMIGPQKENKSPLNINLQPTLRIILEKDSLPLIEMLEKVVTQVPRVLDTFKMDFNVKTS